MPGNAPRQDTLRNRKVQEPYLSSLYRAGLHIAPWYKD